MEARIKKILSEAGSATPGEMADAIHGGNPTKKQSESTKKWLKHLEAGGVLEFVGGKYRLIVYPPETKYMKDLRC